MNNLEKILGSVVETLTREEVVLAAAVFGSAETGELWEGSDIDLFVIIEGDESIHTASYLDFPGVTVHLQILSRLSLTKRFELFRGGPFDTAFGSARVLFCRDAEVAELFGRQRLFPDLDQRKRTLQAFCELLSQYTQLRKGIVLGHHLELQRYLELVLEAVAKVVVFSRRSFPSRKIVEQASRLEPKLLLFAEVCRSVDDDERLNAAVEYVESFISDNIESTCEYALEVLRGREKPISVMDADTEPGFQGINAPFEYLFEAMVKRGLVQKQTRPFTLPGGREEIGREIVYSLI